MGQVKLINSLTGIPEAFPLASVDWTALSALATHFSATMVNVSDVTDTHKTFYYVDNVDVSSITVRDTIKPTDSRSLFRIGSEAAFRANFQPESASVPWSSFDTPATWQVPVQNANALEGHGTFSPNRLYYSNDTASTDYSTSAGGAVGGALGMYPASGNMFALMCIGAKQTSYIGNFYQQSTAGFCPRWRGNFCIDFSTHPSRNYATASAAEVLGSQDVNPIPSPVGLIAQCVYTEISGYPHIAMCAISVDSTGKAQRLSGVFIPAWFWGEYQAPMSTDPADIPQYHGFDAEPEKTSGTYSYTMSDITLPTNPQPFSGMAATAHGLHVYSISQSDYNEILGSLWGDGGLAESLWRKFRNYKFNPIAGVIACHKMPSELMPTSTAIVQVKAAGCPLMSISSAHDITSKAYIDGSSRTLSIPKYFSSHLNYDPYSSIQMFLPFCGWMSIPADRVVGGSISVQYRADVVTGNVCAFIRCFDGDGKNTACYQMTGNAALSIPVTGNDNGVGAVLGAVTASAGLAAAALTGVGGAALIAGAAGAGLATQTARSAMQTGTQYSGNVAALGCLQPFVLITLPVEHTSEEYRELHGLPSGIGLTVGQLAGTGYTEMSEFHADFECMETEQAEIERIMKEGVIL